MFRVGVPRLAVPSKFPRGTASHSLRHAGGESI